MLRSDEILKVKTGKTISRVIRSRKWIALAFVASVDGNRRVEAGQSVSMEMIIPHLHGTCES